MTYRIQRSRLAGVQNFAAIVDVYSEDLRNWRAQEAAADGDAVHRYPAPHAPEVVQLCLNADDRPDFEIVEDVAPDPHPSRLRRDVMLHHVANAAAAAHAKVLAPGKRSLYALRYEEAIAKVKDGVDDRSHDERAFCAEQEKIAEATKAIDRRAAEAQAAVEDLPDEALDSWACPNLEIAR